MKPPTAKDRILKALEDGPKTSRELAKELNMPLGNVPPTITVLHMAGLVTAAGMAKYGKSKKKATIWQRAV